MRWKEFVGGIFQEAERGQSASEGRERNVSWNMMDEQDKKVGKKGKEIEKKNSEKIRFLVCVVNTFVWLR